MKYSTLQKKLPDAPGIYVFRGVQRKILYIGKATSLKDRIRSYFISDIREIRSPLIEKMIAEARSVDCEKTDSVLEALILEANLIKKHQPIYNSREKDDKSFNYLVITKEKFPRVLTIRGKDLKLQLKTTKAMYLFGPFPGGQFKEAMRIVRKMFPYFDTKYQIGGKLTRGQEKQILFNQSIGIYPGKANQKLDAKKYTKTIHHLQLFFEGKKKALVRELEKEMKQYAKQEEFEKAREIRRKIFALTHIRDVSLIKEEFRTSRQKEIFRIEAYDIAHTAGKQVAGVMTVVKNGEIQKNEYRKFRLTKDINNDTANLREMLLRRLAHPEWDYPRLIVVDGGKGQVNTAKKVLAKLGYMIPVMGVVKDERHRPKGFVGDKKFTGEHEKGILLANSEAHRFAIGYHRRLRKKSSFGDK